MPVGPSNALSIIRERLANSTSRSKSDPRANAQRAGGQSPKSPANVPRSTSAIEAALSNTRQNNRIQSYDRQSLPRTSGVNAADSKKAFASQDVQDDLAKQDQEHKQVKTVSDPFMALYERYADEHLGGMGLGEFLATDGSREDRDMWRAFTEDPLINRYYADAIDQAGGFDNWYDQKTGATLKDIMADPGMQYDYFGGSDDTVHSIHDWAAQQGWTPDVSGSGIDSANLAYLFESDPSLAAGVMDYMFAMNALNNQESATDVFSIDEMNNLLALDGLEFGYGDDYTYGDHSVPDEGEQFLAVDPEFWAESLEKGWSSVPGYGLSNRGAAGLMRKRYDTGYMRRPGVDDAYAALAQQQGGDQK